MALVYRAVRQKYAGQPLDTTGTWLNGGRWNPPGVGLLYTAEHAALALVEILVHMPQVAYAELPAFRLFTLEIPGNSLRIMAANELPPYWQDDSYSRSQTILYTWLRAPDVLALGVPSSVMPDGVNYLLHAAHPAYGQIRVVNQKPLLIDPRLWTKG
ncbi:RES family NAD+ phosphorylase [Fibrella aquatica]|uniref:RES family NAD+ phosphorylase n=1 Tax=Fibrella aquatica TaxID=3242487 RepID=UPI0035220679